MTMKEIVFGIMKWVEPQLLLSTTWTGTNVQSLATNSHLATMKMIRKKALTQLKQFQQTTIRTMREVIESQWSSITGTMTIRQMLTRLVQHVVYFYISLK